mmetsp:Transcript_6889/g.17621  ORF Transcript_6889/g.17621 Transcript_6889/m.17621 type:complete len:111 (-) Transcript_6889:32-364(-)
MGVYDELHPRGLEVLAFPTNQFHEQEPGTPQEIRAFVNKYGVTFPMFAKIEVNGPGTHPLYRYLKRATSARMDIRWNFEKFLINRAGRVVKRYHHKTPVIELVPDIKHLL